MNTNRTGRGPTGKLHSTGRRSESSAGTAYRLELLRRRAGGCTWIGSLALAFFICIQGFGQALDYSTEPENGGEFNDTFTMTFFEEMEEATNISFSGSVGFTSEWVIFFPGFPRMILECTPNGTLPAGTTITWTINPGGTGFTTATGRLLPTSSGTFTVAGGGGVTVAPFPADGDLYQPTTDGPVVFSFSEAMDESVDLAASVTFDTGTWACLWTDAFTVECTLEGNPAPGLYNYTLSGFLTLSGTPMDPFSGSFEISDDPGGDLVVVPQPADGATYNPLLGPVTFSFSTMMDQSVNPQDAISFDRGSWDCDWAFPGVPTVTCTPVGGLAGGTCDYTLSGFRSEDGQLYPDFSGSFTVETGGGGDGTYADPCPDVDPPPLTFPKSLAVCGTNFLVWDYATAHPIGSGTGTVIAGSSTIGTGSFALLESMVRLDSQGRFLSGIMAVEPGTEFAFPSDLNTFRASRSDPASDVIAVGAYQADSLTPVYERGISLPGGNVEVFHLPDGRTALVQDANTTVNVVMLTTFGTVAWAKRYASSSFGADGSGGLPGLGGSQFVTLNVMPTGHLLVIHQTKTSLDGSTVTFASTNILARLAEGGAVQWAKKYTGFDGLSAAFVHSTQNGNLVLQGSRTTMIGEDDVSFSSVIVRLDTTGAPLWGKEIDGVSFNVSSDLPGNKLLLVGGLFDAEADTQQTLLGIIDAAGNLERQITVQADEVGYGYGIVAHNRILYGLTSGTSSSTATNTLVGSSSLALDDWTWRRFSQPADNAFLMPRPGSDSSIFSYFNEGTHTVGVVSLNADLEVEAPCSLFTEATVEVVPTSLVPRDIPITVTTDTVSTTDFVPETLSATLPLETFTVAEVNLCDGGSGGDPTPATLAIRLQGTTEVVVEFDSLPNFNYQLRRSTTLGPIDWQNVETIAGSGIRISRTFDADTTESYWQVITVAP